MLVQAAKKAIKSITPIRRAILRRRLAHGVSGQSDEGQILRRLVDQLGAPKTFVEFGFHPAEFNCASLIPDHSGLLIDGSAQQVSDARELLPRTVRIEQRFLTVENLDIIRSAFPALGVLSIDVDGNDYWFLKELMDTNPTIIAVEYNASLGQNSITVPYDAKFDRSIKHQSGWYHGASLIALHKLTSTYGYGLAAVASGGGNAFFTRNGKLDPVGAWKPTALRDKSSATTAQDQWAEIRDMPFIEVQ